jgi:hypothetical protein
LPQFARSLPLQIAGHSVGNHRGKLVVVAEPLDGLFGHQDCAIEQADRATQLVVVDSEEAEVDLGWVVVGHGALVGGHQGHADAMHTLLQRLVGGKRVPAAETDLELFVLLEGCAIV